MSGVDCKEYKQFITRIGDKFTFPDDGKVPFLGSQPIQIVRKYVNHIIGSNILISPKLDGMRYNMYISNKCIQFINRAGVVHEINSLNKLEELTKIGTSEKSERLKINLNSNGEYLFDVEFYDDHIFIFDVILYKEGTKVQKMYKQPFHVRLGTYQGLHSYKLKSAIDSLISVGYHLVPKQFYSITAVRGWPYHDICNAFSDDYPLVKGGIRFDGIIFMNAMYRYYMNPQVGYGQYKWKPQKDLTVDLTCSGDKLVDKRGGEWDRVSGFTGKGKMVEGKTYEFSMSPGTKDKVKLHLLEGKGAREKGANSKLTLDSVFDAYVNCVSFEGITNAFNSLTSSNIEDRLGGWIDSNKALQMCVTGNKSPLITVENSEDIYKGIKAVNNEETTGGVSKVSNNLVDIIGVYDSIHVMRMETICKILDTVLDSEIKSKITYHLGNTDLTVKIMDDIIKSVTDDKDTLAKLNNIIQHVPNLINNHLVTSTIPIATRQETITYNATVGIYKLYEVGYKKITDGFEKRKKAIKGNVKALEKLENDKKKAIVVRTKNISAKNIDVKYLMYKLNQNEANLTPKVEVEFTTRYSNKQGVKKSATYIYSIDKNADIYNRWSLISFADNVGILSPEVTVDLQEIFDYNIVTTFTADTKVPKGGNLLISNNPNKINYLSRRRHRKIFKFYIGEVQVNLVFVKEFRHIAKKQNNQVTFEWEKIPTRKSFIEIPLKYGSLASKTPEEVKNIISNTANKIFQMINF
jgi:hypothetical protein